LLEPDKVTLGAAHVAVNDGAVPNVNVGGVLLAITVNVLAVLVKEVTQPVTVFVTANVYIPAAVKDASFIVLDVTPLGNQVYVKLDVGVTVGLIVTTVFVHVIVPLFTELVNAIVGIVLFKLTVTILLAAFEAQPLVVLVTTAL